MKKAILEVEFDPDMMIDQEALDESFDGDWVKYMRWLLEQEDMGIFEEKIKLVDVVDVPEETKESR